MLKRGDHILPHESQVLRRDLCADTVDKNAGGRAFGIAGALEALEALGGAGLGATGRSGGRSPPGESERFRVYRPGGFGLLWHAFGTFEALSAWMDAYGIVFGWVGGAGGVPPLPGESFELVLPITRARFMPLEDDGAAYDPGPHVRLVDPVGTHAASVSL